MASRDDAILAYRNQQSTQQESGRDTPNDANGTLIFSSAQDRTRTQRARRGSVSTSREETIIAYKNQQSRQPSSATTPPNDVRNTEQQCETTPVHSGQPNAMYSRTNWPSHARICRTQAETETDGQRKYGRGALKGIKVAKKRFANGSAKLNIEFSNRLGGTIGENNRSFVDDVVIHMKRRAPLIGANKWSDIHSTVQDLIVADIVAKWDLEGTSATKKKILTIARERYRGWRSALHSTYKAYTNDAQRLANKPEDVTIEEWEHLIHYFGTDLKFQELSQKNSDNHKKQKAKHRAGSKSYSQISYEKRDPETGQEPTILQLWEATHTRNGSWSNNESHAVYDNACAQVLEKEAEIGGPVSSEEQNDIFQSSYRSTMECRSTQPRGHGYMAKPPNNSERIRAELDEQARANSEIQRQNAELNLQVHDLQNQVTQERAERQREREQERAAREQELEEDRMARQKELEDAKQSMMAEVRQSMMDEVRMSMMAEVRQSMMDEVRQSMREEVVQMMGTQQGHGQQFSQSRAAQKNGSGNVSHSLFKSSSMISTHQLTQAAKNYRRPTSEKDGFL